MNEFQPGGAGVAASPPLIRRMNLQLLLTLIRDHGPISRVELAKATGLSRPTVSAVVDVLVRSGSVDQRVTASNDRKRRPGPAEHLFTFRGNFGYVIGFDVGADKLLATVANLAGEVVARVRRKTPRSATASPEALLETVRDVADDALVEAAVVAKDVWAVCVGTPGVVDEQSGTISLAPQLPAWEGLNLRAELQPLFSCPVHAANEVRLSLLAERWRGAARGIDNALYVQIGVGIGAAVLIGGDVYRGARGAAGEIGYLPFGDADERAERGAGPGPFEHAAGGDAFARHGRAVAAQEPAGAVMRELAGGDPEAVDAEIVFAAARREDPAAIAIVEQLGQRLARGIAAAVVVLDPATVIIGGGLSRAGDALLAPLRRGTARHLPLPVELVLSELGDEAVALGAVKLAIQTADERLFSFESADVAEAAT